MVEYCCKRNEDAQSNGTGFLASNSWITNRNQYWNNIKDFMEIEIWQHEHSKKLRDWFSKTWPPCHKVLFIWVFMLMQSSFNHLMNQLMEFTDFQQFYEKLYTSIFIRLSHCQHFYAENVKKLEMLECIWILSCKMFFQKEILSE